MSSILPTAKQPKSPLGRYRLLSPTASLRVSPLCLGTMSFGTQWKDYMGTCTQETANKILDIYYDNGGNFIDTANNYQFGDSERWIGEWMKKRGNRDQIVIATKFSTCFTNDDSHIRANFTGNGTKSLITSVNESLKKLQTDYIDLLYVHWWDYNTGIHELMQSLNQLVATGKVLYLGISDTPAWVVSRANEYARSHGLRQFSVYQGRWSAASRDFEREIIPMARSERMALAPWGAMGGGAFKTAEQRKGSEGRKEKPTEAQLKISSVLESIAKRKKTNLTSVALAYVMHKTTYVFPIIGCRTADHLVENIHSLSVSLSKEEIDEIEEAAPIELGFPHDFLYGGNKVPEVYSTWLLAMGSHTDYVVPEQPIRPNIHGQAVTIGQ